MATALDCLQKNKFVNYILKLIASVGSTCEGSWIFAKQKD